MMQLENIYGLHACLILAEKHPERIFQAYCLSSRHDEKLKKIIALLSTHSIDIEYKERDDLDKLAATKQHQGIILKCNPAQTQDKQFLSALLDKNAEDIFLLILDNITDPHNLGACIRSAEAAGVDAVIIPKDRSAGLTPTVRKVACGASEILPIISVTNLAQTLKTIKNRGIWLFGAAGDASQNIYQTDLTGSIAVIMGSEGEGLRRLTREHCDHLIHIPMEGKTESLNVSVATGICLFEAVRQRQHKKN